MFRTSNFDKLLDKATSNLRLDPDWPTILQICDLIRQNDCSPKYAVAAVKKKLASQNPHQAMFALLVLESIVKNCGSGVHDEVATKTFCEMLRELVKSSPHENLRNKILELIQAWAFAFRNTPKYRAVQDMVNILKAEGHKFPSLKESDAMFSADTAPEWADGEVCHRCRVAFSLMLRRHHCRACGQVFCQQCSSKTSTIPKYGIEKEVRVCDACYEKMNRPQTAPNKLEIVDTSTDYGPTQQQQKKTGKTAEELQEEEELQLALALSQSEAEHKEKERKTRPYIAPEAVPQPSVSPTPSSVSASPEHSSGNTELSRYLDRGYWEQRLARDASSAPTAPASHTPAPSDDFTTKVTSGKLPDEEAEDRELDEFVGNLKTQVEILVNRMKSNSSRGRSIANDSSVQTLFMNITAMHSRLLRYIQQQDDKRVYLESLQDKVTQVRDSRAALDTLRAEHAARLAAAAEAAERQRQMQMATKLQAMRKKKHEYLQYQRQLALQRVQEQEREMQMRQEQQKHQYMMSSAGFFLPSSVAMHQFQSGYPNQAMYANPQYQSQMLPQATTDTPVPMLNQSMTQANVPLSVNQIGPVPQSVAQISQPYPISTAGMVISQAGPASQAPLNPSNLRASLGQQLPMQSQLLMQHPMQMRMPSQSGVNPMISQNMTNGNLPQPPNQQASQIPKQGVQQSSLLNQLPMGQQNFGHSNANNNPMLSMQMQNIRMPLTQGNQINPGAQSMPGFAVSHLSNQSNQQTGPLVHNMQQQQQQQMSLPGQLTSHTGQQLMQGQPVQHQSAPPVALPNQNLPTQGNQVPSQNQQIQSQVQQVHPQISQPTPLHGQQASQPQTTLGQGVPVQTQQLSHSQTVQGQAMPIQGQQIPHPQGQPIAVQSQIPQMVQGQAMPHPALSTQNVQQHMTSQGQPVQTQQYVNLQSQQMQHQVPGSMHTSQMMNHNQSMPNAGQHISIQGQSMSLQQQIPQNQMTSHNMQIPPQNSQMLTQDSNMQQNAQNNSQGAPGQPTKIQPQNFAPSTPPRDPNQQIQQVPIKSEHNNNTAELISFD